MTYGIRDAQLLEHSPVANVRRPKVSDDSSTVGLTADELDRLLTAAEADGPRSTALISLLVYNGLRIAEALACDIEHLTHQRGHRVLRIVRKGGKASTEPLAPIVLHALEEYVGNRDSGAIFLNADGDARLSYSTSYALIRRLARRAAIAGADKISPHSLRHSFATELLGAGAPQLPHQLLLDRRQPESSLHDTPPSFPAANQAARTTMVHRPVETAPNFSPRATGATSRPSPPLCPYRPLSSASQPYLASPRTSSPSCHLRYESPRPRPPLSTDPR